MKNELNVLLMAIVLIFGALVVSDEVSFSARGDDVAVGGNETNETGNETENETVVDDGNETIVEGNQTDENETDDDLTGNETVEDEDDDGRRIGGLPGGHLCRAGERHKRRRGGGPKLGGDS